MALRLVVTCLHVADARNAESGGADSICLGGSRASGGTAPEPAVLAEIRRATSGDLRPLVKLRDGFSTDGGEVTRLKGLISSYRTCGADGMVLGFINGHSQVDLEVLGELLLDGDWPWTFHRAFDSCLETDRAWRAVLSLPRVDSVVTAGSALGVEHGLDELLRVARSDQRVAALIQAAGDLHPEHVPWLARAGVSKFQIGAAVRPGRSWKAHVDPSLVRSWRTLLDSQHGQDHDSRVHPVEP